ncbi:hypothetical protein DERF_010231 [Dermatophagoides farinae]|uniref:Uncharacterized protein n=1 Tax=Dermatophagoides farinae TaxID=6954 RepID=A0A922HYW6_DERFA|nr:hypothetical protein DERF_010231 [Dermatophagoides farinae]
MKSQTDFLRMFLTFFFVYFKYPGRYNIRFSNPFDFQILMMMTLFVWFVLLTQNFFLFIRNSYVDNVAYHA